MKKLSVDFYVTDEPTGKSSRASGNADAGVSDPHALTPEEAKRIFEHSLEIVCICDLSGKILLSNPAYERLLGYTVEEAQRKFWLEIVHPDDHERAISGLAQINAGTPTVNQSTVSDIRCLCKDGSYKWISWTGVPVLEEGTLFAIGRDVTTQKIAEAENRKLAAIVQSSSDAIVGIDPAGAITSWNNGAERMYGWTSQEALGRNLERLTASDEEAASLRELLEKCRSGEILDNVESIHLRKNGTVVPVSMSLSQVYDEFQKFAGMSAIIRDVSPQKESARRISEFYSMVSHELRTPLASIRGVLGLIEGGMVEPETTEGMELVQIAKGSCDRLVRLVNDILDMRKIQSGGFELRCETVAPSLIVTGAVEAMTGLSMESSILIKVDLEQTGDVYADKDRMVQVLVNLISNALKFAPSGEVVDVFVKQTVDGQVRFSVVDRGPGIAESDLSRLFQMFQQLDSGDARHSSGVGLGLAIARSIVEQHNGKIGVVSAPGRGSEFWFELEAKGV